VSIRWKNYLLKVEKASFSHRVHGPYSPDAGTPPEASPI
jgi:hypothetical protein